jgi:protein-tyrosine phosphatase
MARPDLIDLHAHVLPGVDDGPPDVPSALALARAMVAGGVGTVVATSHVSDRYPNDARTLAAARARLVAALAHQGIPLDVVAGAEVALDQAALLDDEALGALRLGESSFVLVEVPLSPAAADVEESIRAVMQRGHPIVLAHPERAPVFQRSYEQLVRLVADGAMCAVTASAFTGRFGRTARRTAREMLLDGLVHVVTSDAHDLAGRSPALAAELEAASGELRGLGELAPWLLRDAPAAILRGERPPPPPAGVEHVPAPEPKGGRLRRLLRRG